MVIIETEFIVMGEPGCEENIDIQVCIFIPYFRMTEMNVSTMTARDLIGSVNSSGWVFAATQTSGQLEPCHVLRPLGYYLTVIWVLATILNGATLYLFARHKKLRRSHTNIFIGGLIMADFIGAFLGTPLPAYSMIRCR